MTSLEGTRTAVAQGKFVKKLLPSLPRHGQYRGDGQIEVGANGVQLTGSHVMTLGERWLAGVVIGSVALLLTGGIGLAFLYLIVEYALVRRDDREIPFYQIRAVHLDSTNQLIGIDFDAPSHITPAVLRSPDAESLYQALRVHVPDAAA